VIPHPVAIRDWRRNPINTYAKEVKQLPGHHGDFRGVDAVRAEDGAAAALGALIKVVKPLL
jgi:hypothetical protein